MIPSQRAYLFLTKSIIPKQYLTQYLTKQKVLSNLVLTKLALNKLIIIKQILLLLLTITIPRLQVYLILAKLFSLHQSACLSGREQGSMTCLRDMVSNHKMVLVSIFCTSFDLSWQFA